MAKSKRRKGATVSSARPTTMTQAVIARGNRRHSSPDGDQHQSHSSQRLGRPRFSHRRRLMLIVFLILAAPLAYRSYRVYTLRKLAWDASEARQAGNWASLEAIAVRWGQADRNTGMPWALAAEAAEKRGSLSRAAAHLEHLPANDHRTPAALMDLAKIYFGELNRPLQGVATYRKALEMDPRFTEAHRRLIFYYGITVQRNEMVRQAREAIRLGCEPPEAYVYLIGADWLVFSNAYELNHKWLQSGEDNETFEVAQIIHALGARGHDDFERSAKHERLLDEAVEKYPVNRELLAYHLSKRALRGDRDGVVELLGRVPASAADDSRFWHFKGWLDAANGEFEAAETAYREALRRNPYAWQTQLELASVLRQMGRFEEVEKYTAMSMRGKTLRRAILELPDVQSVPPTMFHEIQSYAQQCGDSEVATRLSRRLDQP